MTDWRSLFVASADQSLEFFPPPIVDGVATVTPPQEIFDAGIQEWQFSIVAQFLGKPPNFGLLHRVLSKLWEHRGFVSVKLIESNLFLLQFANAERRDWILENGPWHVQNNSMILRKWVPNLTKLQFDSGCLPLWFHLHNVPLELFTKPGLSYLASAIGNPLYMDTFTAAKKRLSHAKVCVEIKACSEIPNVIKVVLSNGSLASIIVSMPWKPSCCSKCAVFGHVDDHCPKHTVGKVVQVWQPKAVNKDSALVAPQEIELGNTSIEPKDATAMVIADVSSASSCIHDDFIVVARKGSTSGNASKSAKSFSGKASKSSKIAGSTNKFLALCAENLDELHTQVNKGKAVVENVGSDDILQENLDVGNSQLAGKTSPLEVWNQLIDGAKPRKVRAASKGLANVLQEMKSRKAKNLAKIAKQSSSK